MILSLATLAVVSFLPKKAALPAMQAEAPPKRYIALTFDDGPWPKTTELLLDGLRERGVRATFFLIGEQISSMVDTVEQMAINGHQIGNHTYSHVRLDQHSLEDGLREIETTDALLRELLGEGDYWLRPPWGFVSEELRAAVTVPMIHWSIDPEDWRVLECRPVADAILAAAPGGDIILLHDSYHSSVEAALCVVDELLREDVEFVTVEELFALCGETPEPGLLYERPGHTR